MKKHVLLISTSAVIVAVLALATFFLKKDQVTVFSGFAQNKIFKTYSPTLGNPNAKVTVVEFLDPECESCAEFYPTVKALIGEYQDRVRFSVRYMLNHGNSLLAAQATEAAGMQGKYWEMQAKLFDRAQEWSHQEGPQTMFFEHIASGLGLDLEKFRLDMKNPQVLSNLQTDVSDAPKLGVKGTPTFFVNDQMLNELSYDGLKNLIESKLK